MVMGWGIFFFIGSDGTLMAMNSIRKFSEKFSPRCRGGTILALDSGARWVGLAISDESCRIAFPLQPIERGKERSIVGDIEQLIKEHRIEAMVMGLPLRLNGEDSRETQRARDLGHLLENHFDLPVLLWDERFSSDAACRLLRISPIRSKNAMMRHSMAAAWVLEAVLQGMEEVKREE